MGILDPIKFILSGGKTQQASGTRTPVSAPPVQRVTTPNPAYGSGSGYPTANKYDIATGQFTSQPADDYPRAGYTSVTPTQLNQINESRTTSGQTPITQVPQVSGPTNTEGLSADWIKANYPGYAGWSDPNAILADFQATGGAGKGGSAIDTGGSDNPPPSNPPPSDEDLNTAYKEKTGVDLDQTELDDLKAQLGDTGDWETLINSMADRKNAAAETEYNAVMSALSGQKSEVSSTAARQKSQLEAKKGVLTEEADVGKEKDLRTIEEEKKAYQEQYQLDTEKLANNWRDLSRITQAISRASGRQDSSFAQDKESKLLMDFNQGLRALATQDVSTLKAFANGVTDTLDYYRVAKDKLDNEILTQSQNIDGWEQSMISQIQGQEGIALAKKFSDIQAAANQADALRVQIQQNAKDKQDALDTWLFQTKITYQNAVALAAKQGVAKSKDLVSQINEAIKANMIGASKGVDQAGNPIFSMSGYLPGTNEDNTLSLTPIKYRITEEAYNKYTSPSDIDKLINRS